MRGSVVVLNVVMFFVLHNESLATPSIGGKEGLNGMEKIGYANYQVGNQYDFNGDDTYIAGKGNKMNTYSVSTNDISKCSKSLDGSSILKYVLGCGAPFGLLLGYVGLRHYNSNVNKDSNSRNTTETDHLRTPQDSTESSIQVEDDNIQHRSDVFIPKRSETLPYPASNHSETSNLIQDTEYVSPPVCKQDIPQPNEVINSPHHSDQIMHSPSQSVVCSSMMSEPERGFLTTHTDSKTSKPRNEEFITTTENTSSIIADVTKPTPKEIENKNVLIGKIVEKRNQLREKYQQLSNDSAVVYGFETKPTVLIHLENHQIIAQVLKNILSLRELKKDFEDLCHNATFEPTLHQAQQLYDLLRIDIETADSEQIATKDTENNTAIQLPQKDDELRDLYVEDIKTHIQECLHQASRYLGDMISNYERKANLLINKMILIKNLANKLPKTPGVHLDGIKSFNDNLTKFTCALKNFQDRMESYPEFCSKIERQIADIQSMPIQDLSTSDQYQQRDTSRMALPNTEPQELNRILEELTGFCDDLELANQLKTKYENLLRLVAEVDGNIGNKCELSKDEAERLAIVTDDAKADYELIIHVLKDLYDGKAKSYKQLFVEITTRLGINKDLDELKVIKVVNERLVTSDDDGT